MKKVKGLVHLFGAVILISLITEPAASQNAVPMLVNYQGELRSPTTGEPIADGSYEALFRIYDVEFGGTPLWVGTHSSLNGNPVEVTNGLFSVVLGSGEGNALDTSIFNGADRWLEIRVGMETLSPRQRITSVAYAMVAENSRLLDGKEATDFAEAAHTHSGDEITEGVISEERIAPAIARDSEVGDAVATHAAIPDVHHAKTTSFTELTDTASDAQIPDDITVNHAATAGNADTVDSMEGPDLEESAEIDADIAAHAAVPDAHHVRYTDVEAVAAMGAKSDTNPLNHDRITSLPWNSITSIPAGFADGEDDDTTYAAGSGLELAAGVFSADFAGTGSAGTVAHSDHNHDAAYVNEGQPNSVTSGMVADGDISSADIGDGAVTTNDIFNSAVTTAKIANNAVTSAKIADDSIQDADVSTTAGIAGTKIDPNFGSQDVVTTGKVGIGTTGPTAKLQVTDGTLSVFNDDGASLGDHELARFERSELTGYPGIRLGYLADGSGVTGAYLREGGVGGDLELGTGGFPQAMMIKNSGNVGIGTTSPNAKLHVVTNPGQDSIQLSQGEIITNNLSASTSRYVVSIGGTWYWGLGKTSTGNSNFHIINYPSSRWDLTIRNDTGNVGIGTTSPQEKLDVNGNARVAADLTVVGTATLGGVSMGKIHLNGSGTILSTDGGTRVLYWDKTNSEIELTNTSGDWCDYWWQAQKGTTTSGDATSLASPSANVAIISGIGTTNCHGCEVHFGQADGEEGWCSVWLQYANGNLVGHYIKY